MSFSTLYLWSMLLFVNYHWHFYNQELQMTFPLNRYVIISLNLLLMNTLLSVSDTQLSELGNSSDQRQFLPYLLIVCVYSSFKLKTQHSICLVIYLFLFECFSNPLFILQLDLLLGEKYMSGSLEFMKTSQNIKY